MTALVLILVGVVLGGLGFLVAGLTSWPRPIYLALGIAGGVVAGQGVADLLLPWVSL